jgi:hypothetical protein
MTYKVITTVTNPQHPGFLQFRRSMDHFGWDYEIIHGNYQAYGSKMVNAYEYAKRGSEDYLFILDAYDIFMLGTPEEAFERVKYTSGRKVSDILFNAEKGCWPYDQWSILYPEVKGPWKYLNGGAAFVYRKAFINMFEMNPIKHEDNDQVILGKTYITKPSYLIGYYEQYIMDLDNDCNLFQSIAFEAPEDFNYSQGILHNNVTGADPIIIHGNGKTDMKKIYELLR